MQPDKRHHREAYETVADPLFVIEAAPEERLRVVIANPACEYLFGIPVERCQGQFIDELLPEAAASRLKEGCERCVRLDGPTIEIRIELHAAACTRVYAVKLNMMSPTGDQVIRLAVSAHDVTELLDLKQRSNEDQFRIIAEHASDYFCRYDREGRILYMNPALERVAGARTVKISLDWMTQRFHQAFLTTVATGQPQRVEVQFRDSTDSVLHHDVCLEPEWNAKGEVISVIAIGRDITELKVTEAKLRQREEEFRTIAENSPDLIFRCDLEGRYTYASPPVERMTGIPVSHYIGTRPGEAQVPRALPGDEHRVPSVREALRRVISTGIPEHVDTSGPDVNGVHRALELRLIPERDLNGATVSVLLIGRDTTEQKATEAELKNLNATLEARVEERTLELERANRDLKSFAYTASHDLRAPLRTIAGFINVISEQEGEHLSENGRSMLGRVSSAATKLNGLINAILAYSQAGQRSLSKELVPMGRLAREVAEELIEQSSNIRIEIADLPAAYGDVTMLRQILQNLIGNAIKFSSDGSEPRIDVNWRREDEQIVYYVRDNGVGFDTRYADRLCSMFQRLHSDVEFPGSGVGLAIVKRLVERHGGCVWAESQPGKGATFFFTLANEPASHTSVPALVANDDISSRR